MLRTGWFWPVHVKSLDSHRLKTLPGARDQLVKAKRSLREHFGTTGKNTIRTKQAGFLDPHAAAQVRQRPATSMTWARGENLASAASSPRAPRIAGEVAST